MEILAENTHYGSWIFVLIIAGAFTVLFTVCFIAWIVEATKSGIDGAGEIFGILVIVFLLGLSLTGFISTYALGPEVTYKAKITDFNEVYKNGYEIVEKDGKIHTIQESQ